MLNIDISKNLYPQYILELSEGELSEGEIPDFDDGLDDNLVGDEADRRKLAMMTEKEREQELFNRMEKREALKTRMEIEQVLAFCHWNMYLISSFPYPDNESSLN